MKGVIKDVRNLGTIWQIDVKTRKGTTIISGDWRPMREGIEDAFGSPENAIGQEIEYTPAPIFGAKYWKPTGKRKLEKVV